MAKAEADYERAFEAIPALPSFFQGPVAVAASVYRGILQEIRENDYDNLGRRASTSLLRKIGLGAGGLWALRRSAATRVQDRRPFPGPPSALSSGEGPGGGLMKRHGQYQARRLVLMGGILALMGALGTPGLAEGQRSGARSSSGGANEDPAVALWAKAHLEQVSALPSPDEGMRLERIRAMYFLSVGDGDWVSAAKDSISSLEPLLPPGSTADVASQAYRGALEVVRAKHSRWPPNKLKYLRSGSRILDDLVARYPDNLEVRYLRLASYRFLPIFLRRDESVAEDLQVLTEDLPTHPGAFSPTIFRGVLRFVLANGIAEGELRAGLEKALQRIETRERDARG